MSLKKRQQLFVQYYLDRSNKETFENGTNSALRAGYSPGRAASQGSWLTKQPHIREEIARYRKAEENKWEITKEQAIQEARYNFLNAKTDTMKKYWNDIYLKLKGWDISRTINETSITEFTSDESDYYTEFVRGIVKEREN